MNESLKPLLEILDGVVPDPKIKELIRGCQFDVEQLVSAPETLLFRLLKSVSDLENHVDKGKLLASMHTNVSGAWKQWADGEIKADLDDRNQLAQLPSGKEIVECVFKIISNSEKSDDILGDIRNFVKNPAIARWASSFHPHQINELGSNAFEPLVRTTASSVSKLAETYYKDFLSLMYLLSRECAVKKMPETLGSLVSHCKDSWKGEHAVLRDLLYDELVLVRNSEFHCNTVISVSTETVLFRDAGGKKFGPLNLLQYHNWYANTMQNLINLSSVFRVVFRRYWMLFQMANC